MRERTRSAQVFDRLFAIVRNLERVGPLRQFHRSLEEKNVILVVFNQKNVPCHRPMRNVNQTSTRTSKIYRCRAVCKWTADAELHELFCKEARPAFSCAMMASTS